MNPDRATLNFLNSFSEEARHKGEEIQQEAAVQQIFGNHLYIQGRVEYEGNLYKTLLRLQGNHWFGSCNAEDEDVRGACLYATMKERLERGSDLPETPNEMDDQPLIDVIEEKLDREVTDKEADFISKLEKRYRRYVIEGELHDHDLVRLHSGWEINSYDPISIWPIPPADIVEFWNYIAYAFFKKKIQYPEFLEVITDLSGVQDKMREWEKEQEISRWYDRIDTVQENAIIEVPRTVKLRLLSTINEARLELQWGNSEIWEPINEQAIFDNLEKEYLRSAILMDMPSQLLFDHFSAHSKEYGVLHLDLDKHEACAFMNRLFHQPKLKGYMVNLDELPFKVSDRALHWKCLDIPGNNEYFNLELRTDEGNIIAHSVRLLQGCKVLYQSDETVFQGPPQWVEETEIQPNYYIPTSIINSLDGVEFLRKIGASLPESIVDKVVDIDLVPSFDIELIQGLNSAETEHLVINVEASDKQARRTEKYTKQGWEVIEQKIPNEKSLLLRFDRRDLYHLPDYLADMGLSYDQKIGKFKVRVSKHFPEKFHEWYTNLPKSIQTKLDGKLQSLMEDPVSASVRFEVVNQEIDWFDLRVVIDVEGIDLSKAQIRSLVAARGGYVRMEDGTWMRLDIKLNPSQRQAVTRLGLDPFDLTGETHRMHALHLVDSSASEIFDPQAWNRICTHAQEIEVDVQEQPPKGLKATLRPYQLQGFQFLVYLAKNKFGGILADDMGLGKTLQSLAYILWLKEEEKKAKKPHQPCLVVCPKSVLDVWAQEAQTFTPQLKVSVLRNRSDVDPAAIKKDIDILVINYAQLRICNEELEDITWLTVVMDEGQQIKNPDSKAAKSSREIKSDNRLVLSGTPIENRLLDMWSLMSFAMPGVLGSKAYFREHFDKRKDTMAQNRLASRLRPFLLRRTKLQVAKDLPPRTEEEVFADMEPVQAELYNNELKRIQQSLLGSNSDDDVKKNSFAILQGLMRLRQICCHPGLIDPKFMNEESSKINSLFYLLDQLYEQGHKVLVFSQFVAMLNIIRSRLESESRPFHYLTGKTKDRKAEIESFQTTKDPSVFLLSLKAGGAGLNLTSASYVVLFDPWWNPAVENQAIDRTHRIGQKSKVIAYRLITRNTVEEKIRVLQHQKTSLVTNILGGESFASSLSVDDLKAILESPIDIKAEDDPEEKPAKKKTAKK